jgi:nucleoside-diphosphate-sugar epimerase
MLKILITGGNGYIARSLYSVFSRKYNCKSISILDFDLSNANQTKRWFEENEYYDIVIHTAIKGGMRLVKDTANIMDVNLKMYYNLLENKDRFNKLISFGSGAEIFQPETPYGLSKKVIAESIKEIDNFYNIRIFAVFDEDELDTRFIKHNILQYIKKEPIKIYNNKIMDFFYMKDLLSVIDYYINNDTLDKEFNCSYVEKYTLKDIADMINSLNNHKVPIIIQSNNELKIYAGQSNLKIKTIGLKEGLKNTYDILNRQFN